MKNVFATQFAVNLFGCQSRQSRVTVSFCVALATTLIAFLLEGRSDFNLWDEGFLWYGAQRVLHGEVPIRDFQSYDIARYYFVACFMWVMNNDGITTLRICLSLFQLSALVLLNCTLLDLNRMAAAKSVGYLTFTNVIIHIWMRPYYATFDMSVSLISILVLRTLSRSCSTKSAFLAGLYFGLLFSVGRNHALYFLVGLIVVGIAQQLRTVKTTGTRQSSMFAMIGVVIGLIPIGYLMLAAPGFVGSYLESYWQLFQRKSTNLPLPFPYPWTLDYAALGIRSGTYHFLSSLYFVLVLAYGIVAVPLLIYQRVVGLKFNHLVIGASALALPYAHYVHSRADVEHLGRGIFPLIVVGVSVLISGRLSRIQRIAIITFTCVSSLCVTNYFHTFWDRVKGVDNEEVTIQNETVFARYETAVEVNLLSKLVADYSITGDTFLTAPYNCSSYAIFRVKSPLHDIYFLFPATKHQQLIMIKQLKSANIAFIWLSDKELDGIPNRKFSVTHPLVDSYIKRNYKPIHRTDLPANSRLFVRNNLRKRT